LVGEKITKLLAWGNNQAQETLAINERTNAITGKFAEPSGKDLLKSKLLFDSIEHKYGLPKGMLTVVVDEVKSWCKYASNRGTLWLYA
jgi:hypothetical protein